LALVEGVVFWPGIFDPLEIAPFALGLFNITGVVAFELPKVADFEDEAAVGARYEGSLLVSDVPERDLFFGADPGLEVLIVSGSGVNERTDFLSPCFDKGPDIFEGSGSSGSSSGTSSLFDSFDDDGRLGVFLSCLGAWLLPLPLFGAIVRFLLILNKVSGYKRSVQLITFTHHNKTTIFIGS